MSENKKFILVAILIFIIFTGEKLWRRMSISSEEKKKSYVVKMEKHTYKQVDEPLDINTATLEDMLKNKVSMSYAKKILEYREVTGGFENTGELTRISGIGKKTYDRLKTKFVVESYPVKNRININRATKTELTYAGFTKKEIKKIQEYIEENTFIFDNVAFLELIGEKRYHETKDRVRYD